MYSRLQSAHQVPSVADMPLENVKDWRETYPHLASLMDQSFERLNCDIILLNADLELMSDFPPSGSKLGIKLELDFSNPLSGELPSSFGSWT